MRPYFRLTEQQSLDRSKVVKYRVGLLFPLPSEPERVEDKYFGDLVTEMFGSLWIDSQIVKSHMLDYRITLFIKWHSDQYYH